MIIAFVPKLYRVKPVTRERPSDGQWHSLYSGTSFVSGKTLAAGGRAFKRSTVKTLVNEPAASA